MLDDLTTGLAPEPKAPDEPDPFAPPTEEEIAAVNSAEPDPFAPPTEEELAGEALPDAEPVEPPETEESKLERLGVILGLATEDNLDRQAGVVRLAKETGLDTYLVDGNYDTLRKRAEAAKRDPKTFAEWYPGFTDTILQRPEVGKIIVNDGILQKAWKGLQAWRQASDAMIAGVGKPFDPSRDGPIFESETWKKSQAPREVTGTAAHGAGLWESVSGTYKREAKGIEASKLGFEAIFDRKGDSARERKILDLQRESSNFVDYGGNTLAQMATDAAGLVASQKETIKGGGAGAVVAAAGGLAAGVATRSPAVGRQVAGTIWKAAVPTGAALASFRMESGGAFLEFRDEKLDDGTPLDPDAARAGALAYGAVASTIELAGTTLALKMFGPLGDAILKGNGQAFVRGLLRQAGPRRMLSDAMKRWVQGAGGEGLEEFSQQLAQGLVGYATKSAQAGGLQRFDGEGIVGSALDAGGTALSGSLVMGAGGASVNLGTQIMAGERAERSPDVIQSISQIAESPTAKADPDAAAEIIAAETARTGEAVTSVYVDPKALETLFQGGEITPQQLFGEDGEKNFQEALARADSIEVPVAAYLKWGELTKGLEQDVAVRPGELTKRQREGRKEEIETRAKEIFEAEKAGEAVPGESAAEDRWLAAIRGKIVVEGKALEGKDEAAAIAPLRKGIRTLAARMGVDPETLFAANDVLVRQETAEEAAARKAENSNENAAKPGVNLADAAEVNPSTEVSAAELTPQVDHSAMWAKVREQQMATPEGEATPQNLGARLAATSEPSTKPTWLAPADYYAQQEAYETLWSVFPADKTDEATQKALLGLPYDVLWVANRFLRTESANDFQQGMKAKVQDWLKRKAVGDQAYDLPLPPRVLEMEASRNVKKILKGKVDARARAMVEMGRPRADLSEVNAQGELVAEDGSILFQGPTGTKFEQVTKEHDDRLRASGAPGLVALDGEGNVLAQHDGTSIPFDSAVKMRERGNAVLTTSHADSSGFDADGLIAAMVTDAAEARLLGKDGSIFSVKRPEGGWRYDPASVGALQRNLAEAWTLGLNDARGKLKSYIEDQGGNPADGAKAKGFSFEVQDRIIADATAERLNAFSRDRELAWVIERSDGSAQAAIPGRNPDGRKSVPGRPSAVGYEALALLSSEELRAWLASPGPAVDPAPAKPAPAPTGNKTGAAKPSALAKQAANPEPLPAFNPVAQISAERLGSMTWGEMVRELGVKLRQQEETLFQPAWHGTPHRGISKFSLDKIGTGEGAQAYGWGLYFAKNKKIAEYYRKSLTDGYGTPAPVYIKGKLADDGPLEEIAEAFRAHQNLPDAINDLQDQVIERGANIASLEAWIKSQEETRAKQREMVDGMRAQGGRDSDADMLAGSVGRIAADILAHEKKLDLAKKIYRNVNGALEIAKQLKPEEIEIRKNKGQLYEVDVPDDSELLDYDRPLSEQPKGVLSRLSAAGLLPERFSEWVEVVKKEHEASDPKEKDALHAERVKIQQTMTKGRVRASDEGGWRMFAGEGVSPLTGRDLYRDIAHDPKLASEYLRKAGIPGLRYLDATSRDSGEGSHNFVIWSEEAIDVLNTMYEGNPSDPRGYVKRNRENLKRVFEIVLTEKADLSTFLHESGHVFFDMLADLSALPDAPQQIRDDYATLLKEVGAEPGKVKRVHHEKFARMFESYLMEGKAPSVELRQVFRRFARWLKDIYKRVAKLDAPMNDDVRAVFDRLLATDEEIAASKERMGWRPMWRSPTEAGMSPEQWQNYLDEQEQTNEYARRAAELRELRDQLRAKKPAWVAEQKKALEDARLEYDALPAARARRFIETNEIVGEDGKALATLEGEPNQDEVAQLFGYATGPEMASAALALPERDAWAKAKALDLMKQRHAEEFGDREKLRELTEKALHEKPSSKWLLREYQALNARKQQGPGGAPVESIEGAAQMMVDSKRLRDLTPGRALQAERQAAERAHRASAKGDFAAALVAKQQQLLNHFLWRKLTEAKKERDAFEKLTSDLAKDSIQAKIAKAHPAYVDGINGILEALGIINPAELDRAQAGLGEVIAVIESHANTPGFDPDEIAAVLSRLPEPPRTKKGNETAKHLGLTVADMRTIRVALENIRVSARTASTVIIDERREDKEFVIGQLQAEAEKNLPALGPVSSSVPGEGYVQAGGSWFSSLDGSLLKLETMIGWLSGGDLKSIWYRALMAPIQKAKQHESDLYKKAAKPVYEAMQKLLKSPRAFEAVDGAKLFPTHRTDIAAPTKRFELLMMASNVGNASNIERVTEGRQITLANVMAVLNDEAVGLTQEEWGLVKAVWEANETLRPLAFDLEERDSGLRPARIEPTPVITRFGTLPGGYVPAVYDRRVQVEGERQAGAQSVAELMDPTFTRAGTAHSHLKKRAKHFSGVIALDPSTITAHLSQVVHDIAYREAIKSVGSLILDARVQATLRQRLGPRSEQFLQWVKDVGQQRSNIVTTHAGVVNRGFSKLKANAGVAILGYAADVALGDAANLAVAFTVVKAKHLGAGYADFIGSPVKQRAFALEMSGELRFRDEGVKRELDQSMKKLVGNKVLDRGPIGWWKDHAWAFMEWSDAYTATPVWLGAYRQALAEEKSDADAVEFADSIIRKIFPSGSVADKAAWLRAPSSSVVGALTMFQGYANVLYNRERDIAHQLHTAAGIGGTLKATPKVAGQLLALWVTANVFSELLMARGPEDGEEWDDWFKRKLAMAPLYSIPLVGGPAERFFTGKQASIRNAPAMALIEQVGKTAARVYKKGEIDEKSAEDIAKTLALLLGVPVSKALKGSKALASLFE